MDVHGSERCKFYNRGHCKYILKGCKFFHPPETCANAACSDSNCQFRHPKTCKFQWNCNFATNCSYSHVGNVEVNDNLYIKMNECVVIIKNWFNKFHAELLWYLNHHTHWDFSGIPKRTNFKLTHLQRSKFTKRGLLCCTISPSYPFGFGSTAILQGELVEREVCPQKHKLPYNCLQLRWNDVLPGCLDPKCKEEHTQGCQCL